MIIEFKEDYSNGKKNFKKGDKVNVCPITAKRFKDLGVIVGSRKKRTEVKEEIMTTVETKNEQTDNN